VWKLLLAGQALVALTLPAMAADVAPYFSPPPVPEWNWTGFYVGANTGWVGSVSNDVTNTGTDTGIHGLGSALVHGKIPSSVALTESGFIGGAQFGYNWQVGSVWVWGAEVDVDGVNAKSSATAAFPGGGGAVPFATVYNRQLDTLGTLRGRWGFLQPPGLLWFATGGLAYGETKIGSAFTCATCGPPAGTQPGTAIQSSGISFGWTLGAGLEWNFAPSWSVKAEYLYVDLGSQHNTITYSYSPHLVHSSTLTSTVTDTQGVARVGINYQFGSFF